MKDSEIKSRVAAFLRQAAKQVVLPATLGLGFGLGGCDGQRVVQQPGDDAALTADAALVEPAPPGVNPPAPPIPGPPIPPSEARYGAPFLEPDAAIADQEPDVGPVDKYGAPFPADAAPPNASMYAAPFPAPDAGPTADPDASA